MAAELLHTVSNSILPKIFVKEIFTKNFLLHFLFWYNDDKKDCIRHPLKIILPNNVLLKPDFNLSRKYGESLLTLLPHYCRC